MLSDYKRYLLKIRNSLIRCGVELGIKDVQDYEEVFYLGEKLSDLLWFYSILEVSGSEDKLRGFIFPLNSFYKNSLRDKYFEDYLIYRSEYMKISSSDAIIRSKLDEVSNKKEDVHVHNTLSFIQGIQSKYTREKDDLGSSGGEILIESDKGEDEFINYTNEEEENEIIEEADYSDDTEIEEDDYSNWNNFEEEVEEENEIIEEADYPDDTEIEEDEFINYTNEEDDDYSNWNNSDEEVEEENEIIEEEDDYSNWNNSDDTEIEEYGYSNWGNSDEDIEESTDSEIEDDAFGNWGCGDEDDTFEGNVDSDNSEDIDDTGFSDDCEDDAFGNWGCGEESDSDSEESDGSGFGSWGTSSETSNYTKSEAKLDQNLSSKKSKVDYEIESNEKMAKAIEKIASGIFNKGILFKSKVIRKSSNMGENCN